MASIVRGLAATLTLAVATLASLPALETHVDVLVAGRCVVWRAVPPGQVDRVDPQQHAPIIAAPPRRRGSWLEVPRSWDQRRLPSPVRRRTIRLGVVEGRPT